jgi:hypothetical protein
MSGGNPSGLEKSRGPERIGTEASTTSAPWVPPISHEILRDLGMSDDEIAQYCYRFRHGRSEQLVQRVLHNTMGCIAAGGDTRATKELYHGHKRIPQRADGKRNAV